MFPPTLHSKILVPTQELFIDIFGQSLLFKSLIIVLLNLGKSQRSNKKVCIPRGGSKICG